MKQKFSAWFWEEPSTRTHCYQLLLNSNIQNYSKCFISVPFPCCLTHDHCLLIYTKKRVYNLENLFLLGKSQYFHFNNHRRKNINVCPCLPLNSVWI